MRESREAPWGAPTLVKALDVSGVELYPAISSDGLTIYFEKDAYSVYRSTRPSITSDWGTPVLVPELQGEGLFLSRDGLEFYATPPTMGFARWVRSLNYEWDFTSDGIVDSTDPVVAVTYNLGGPYTATLTVTDPSGESDTHTVTVTAVDTTLPVLTPPADVTAEQGDRAGTAVVLGVPSVSDICDASPVVTNDAPGVFPLEIQPKSGFWGSVDRAGVV
jgi:hypothetical protein